MYITIKLTDSSIRTYPNIEKATNHCIEMNRDEEDHPAFKLFKDRGSEPAEYIGRLVRGFGADIFHWEKD